MRGRRRLVIPKSLHAQLALSEELIAASQKLVEKAQKKVAEAERLSSLRR